MKTRPRRRAPGNVTPAYLVRIDLKKQRLFAALEGKRTVNIVDIANEAGATSYLVREVLKRLGWKKSTKYDGTWFLP